MLFLTELLRIKYTKTQIYKYIDVYMTMHYLKFSRKQTDRGNQHYNALRCIYKWTSLSICPRVCAIDTWGHFFCKIFCSKYYIVDENYFPYHVNIYVFHGHWFGIKTETSILNTNKTKVGHILLFCSELYFKSYSNTMQCDMLK